MNFKELSALIGRRIWLRKIGYRLIYWTTLREWYIYQALHRLLRDRTDDVHLLDVGCGLGQHLYDCAVRRPSSRILGLEQDEQMVRDLHDFLSRCRISNAAVVCADILQWQPQGEYDVILCGSVLEHVEEDTAVLRKLSRCLKPEGCLLIYVPSAEKRMLKFLHKKITQQVSAAGKKFPHDHVRYYQPSELREKIQPLGLTVVQTTITYGRWGRWSYDLVTLVQLSRFFKWLFPVYLVLLHPFVLLLMLADFMSTNHEGNGLLMMARKLA